MTTAAFYFAFLITLFLVMVLVLTALSGNQGRVERRARQLMLRTLHLDTEGGNRRRALQSFERLMRATRARIGMADDEKLRQRFLRAGRRDPGDVELYLAARVLGPMLGVIAGSFFPSNTFFWAAALAAAAYLAPDFWLERTIKGRRERIRRSIPDAVDLLVICVDAGLGIDQAMLRVGQELAISHREINEEFLQINREQRAGRQRMDAWAAMAERTKVPEILAFTSMLMQTEKFGTPIARALSTFADGVRQKRRQRAEEMAAKTTVKMLFPLVLFIFPCMFIVLLAPAVLSIARGLAGLGQ